MEPKKKKQARSAPETRNISRFLFRLPISGFPDADARQRTHTRRLSSHTHTHRRTLAGSHAHTSRFSKRLWGEQQKSCGFSPPIPTTEDPHAAPLALCCARSSDFRFHSQCVPQTGSPAASLAPSLEELYAAVQLGPK